MPKSTSIELVFCILLPKFKLDRTVLEICKNILYSTFHENYTTFKQNIDECINNAFCKGQRKLNAY